jgi:hypothetical protein
LAIRYCTCCHTKSFDVPTIANDALLEASTLQQDQSCNATQWHNQ